MAVIPTSHYPPIPAVDMQIHKVAFTETHSFSSFFLDYIQQKPELGKFYHRFPLKENFGDQIKEKRASYPKQHREVLVKSIANQYQHLEIVDAVKQNIESLGNENTFTVTTGHQLNVFTGPLYFIYKIVTVINACRQLKEQYPGYHFVPVYWMASEDHDYEEIKSFRLYGKKYTWHTDQTGAVGRFNPKSIQSVLDEMPGDITPFREAYLKHNTLSDAVRYYVNKLFEKEGLVVVDADDRDLKGLFRGVIQDDVFVHTPKKLVDERTQALESLGYHTQVHARDINFFYLDKGLRSRLENDGDGFQVVDTSLRFSNDQMVEMINHEPEKFSPNVILRPLYQEVILPNLAYVGGPSEVVYWLQLKGVFDLHGIPFPMLMPRNFGMVLEPTVLRKFEKTGLEIKDLFEEKNYLFNHWVVKNTTHNLSLGKELEAVTSIFSQLKDRAAAIDTTLNQFVGAETKRALHSLEKIEKKMMKAEKRLHKDKLGQIESVKDALFPNGSLQERTDNFLNFYQQNPQFIHELMSHFDPFDYRFTILLYK